MASVAIALLYKGLERANPVIGIGPLNGVEPRGFETLTLDANYRHGPGRNQTAQRGAYVDACSEQP